MFSDRLHELNSYIHVYRHVVTTYPRASPLRIGCVQALAIALKERYYLLGQVNDLEQSILHYTEATLLPRLCDGHFPNIAQNFLSTAFLLIFRAAHTEQPGDVRRPIICLRYLRGQPLEAFNISPDDVNEMLVHALALQVKLELGDVMQDIEEMADLLLELLTSKYWTISTRLITCFVEVVELRHGGWHEGQEPLAKVIDCLRRAKNLLPNSDELSITFACTLLSRFYITYSNDDYEEGTTILDKFLTSHAPGDNPSQYLVALQAIYMFSFMRLNKSWTPECMEEAIYRLRTLLAGIPPEDPRRLHPVECLKSLQTKYFEDFGVGCVQEDHFDDAFLSGQPAFRHLTASMAVSSIGTREQRPLALFSATDMAEIEEAINACQLLVASVHGDRSKSLAVCILGALLLHAFELTNNLNYVNEAISILRGSLNSPMAQRSREVLILSYCYLIRFDLCHSREDLDELMQLYQIAVDRKLGCIKVADRFKMSCQWAALARIYSHPSTSTAYYCALSLMWDSLTFAPAVDIQHSRLVAMRDHYETLPLDCASYQVHTGQLQSAIETFERGRGFIWSEMRGLRSSIDQLRAYEPHLADKLTAINQDIEDLTLTLAQNNYVDGGKEGLEGTDLFSRLVVRQQELLDDRDDLIFHIRALNEFESFLKPPSFDVLRFAAAHGPVIMINHCRWRSDIIILLYNSPPSLIRTGSDFYDRANKLRDQLSGARKKGLDSVEYDDALRSVLKELYEIVGRPVIQRLNELQVPAQSRVWWCPTSAFCFLPLHAMGPIPSDSGPPRYFLDLYIPSYTPTLTALIESNKPGSQTLGKPSLLLVLQPDPSMKDALDEMHVVQSINTQVKALISERATPTAVLDRLKDHKYFHFACHGIPEPGKPFDSSFKLYQGNRLTLLDFIRSRLLDAEFAFLSACHPTELTDTDGSFSDEGLHMSAAVQYCGFRSVVGTMWAMADTDGRHLAQGFYKSVFSAEEDQGVYYYERTAEALRDAVIKLRRRKVTLERWVNFMHYGA
jgi:CHAT domain-containing protein